MFDDRSRQRRTGLPIGRGSFRRLVQKLEAHLFLAWLERQHVDRSAITQQHVARFLSRHLPRCRCSLGGTRYLHSVRAALRRLDTVIHRSCRRPRQRCPLSAIDREVRRFDQYLHATCGVQEATRVYRRRYLREFLRAQFPEGQVDRSQLTSTAVIKYVIRRASRLAPGSAKVVASSLRSYFRFLQLHGACDEALVLAVPAPSTRSLTSLPKPLTDDDVRRLLAAFDRGTATGRRDYAITRCVLDLGLRANDVAALTVNDIDWRAGTLRIAGGKSRRGDTLPLPAPVGRAIAVYLRRDRPQRSTRQLFLSVRPRGRALTWHIVRNVIRDAGRRAGLATTVTGTRVLRQTTATRLLRQGASLKAIADILRHRSLDTAAIYTKVDVPRLAAVAAPWPQEARR
jgi:integrase/recombinase XerD